MSLVLRSLLPYPNSCQGTSPHQQGWDTKMAMLSFCGVDVSKDRLDVVVLPEGWFFSVSNDTAGWAELFARLRPLTVSAIGLEPSGGYERGIIRALLAAGLSVRRINPNKLRQFARARGVLAKNDRLDARLIAEYVAIMPTRVVQRDAAVEKLAEIVTCGDSCVTSMLRPRTRRLISKMPCSGGSANAARCDWRPISASSTSAWPRWLPPMSLSLSAMSC